MKADASLPSSLVFLILAFVAALLGNLLYSSYKKGAVFYLSGRQRPYRRATKPFRFWFFMAVMGFSFVVCTLGTLLMLYLMVTGQ